MADPSPADELDFCYLTTTGRRTGKPHRIEIWFAREGEFVYLMSGGRDASDWVRNIEASPDVVLELGSETVSTTARIIEPDSEEDALARSLLVRKYGPRSSDDLDEWGRTSLPVAVSWP